MTRRSEILIVVPLLLAIAIAFKQASPREAAAPKQHRSGFAARAADVPLSLPPVTAPLFPVATYEATKVHGLLMEDLSGPVSGPVLAHLLRIYGLAPIPHRDVPTGAYAVELLINEECASVLLGSGFLTRTRSGIRFRSAEDIDTVGENHRNVLLSTLAEIGLPLSTPVATEGGTHTIRDILEDSVAHFHLGQEEIEWTSIALVLYMGNRPSWENRDGEHCTFNQLAEELMGRSLGNTSCGGAHVLYALTLMYRADQQSAILSESVRRAVREYLEAKVLLAVERQAPEGCWSRVWYAQGSAAGDESVAITGHLLEWMQYLPPELAVEWHVRQTAANWLLEHLRPPTNAPAICPWTHAVCALRNELAQKP